MQVGRSAGYKPAIQQIENLRYEESAATVGHPTALSVNPGDVLRDKEHFAQTTNQFEIVYQGSLNDITNWGSTIVMREKEAWQSPSGGWLRTYGFADGHTEIHKATDGNFENWEQQHMMASSVQSQPGQ